MLTADPRFLNASAASPLMKPSSITAAHHFGWLSFSSKSHTAVGRAAQSAGLPRLFTPPERLGDASHSPLSPPPSFAPLHHPSLIPHTCTWRLDVVFLPPPSSNRLMHFLGSVPCYRIGFHRWMMQPVWRSNVFSSANLSCTASVPNRYSVLNQVFKNAQNNCCKGYILLQRSNQPLTDCFCFFEG